MDILKKLKLSKMKEWMPKNPLELILLVLFAIYLLFPISTPRILAPYIDSTMGLCVVFALIVFMFLYSHPLLAILFILVAYELVRRSSLITGRTAYIQYTPTQEKKDAKMRAMNPPQEVTLEQDMVAKMAPQLAVDNDMMDVAFKPAPEKVKFAVSTV
jgi:predicted membrane protein